MAKRECPACGYDVTPVDLDYGELKRANSALLGLVAKLYGKIPVPTSLELDQVEVALLALAERLGAEREKIPKQKEGSS